MDQTAAPQPENATDSSTQGTKKDPEVSKSVVVPESLRVLQSALVKREKATDNARKSRNIEVARLRDVEKVSQYRIAKWLGVTERAVMHMANSGREAQQESSQKSD